MFPLMIKLTLYHTQGFLPSAWTPIVLNFLYKGSYHKLNRSSHFQVSNCSAIREATCEVNF